ncbi:MAG TPA: arabinan endo-1,5-alpha-L-arabinosidase [Opitutales bacterium]|jgi:arabinan endo-1,5-alpha-L-arabinosidase|nr:arabinan endo-1,5-alpha-L-arabinosidase [Opitutales bacterium]
MKRRLFLRNTLAASAAAYIPSRLFAAAPAASTPAASAPPAGSAATAANTPAKPATVDIATATAALYKMGKRNVAMHDPSAIVKCKDEYWIYRSQNQSYRSKDLLNWTAGPRNAVLSASFPWFNDAVPGYANGPAFWAPDCIKVGDKYFLFYAISAFGKNTSAIGLVTSPTLDPADPDYAWADQGMVVKSVKEDNFNCIDPAACFDADGNLWLAFGSFWSGIKMIALDKTGHRIPDSPMHSLAQNNGHATATPEGALTDSINKSQIEASYIYHHENYYYLFVNWGLCCHALASTYNIRVGRSEKITGPYLDKDGKDLLHDGGTMFFESSGPLLDSASTGGGGRGGRRGGGANNSQVPAQVHALVGPGQAGIFLENGKHWFTCHYYDGTANGNSFLIVRPLTWDKATGWPVLEEYADPVPIPTPTPRGGGGGGRRGGGAVPAASGASAPAPAASSASPASSTATN